MVSSCLAKNRHPCLHVALGVNESYVFPMGVAVTSILENNPGLPIHFHVFATSISESDRDRLRCLEEQFDARIEIYPVDDEFLKGFADIEYIGHLNPACFIRILAPYQLASVADRVLYIDSDVICQGRLDDLLEIGLGGAISACVDDFPEITKQQCQKLSLAYGRYFNAGVMLIDTALWNKERITQRVFEMVKADKSFSFADQDVLNRLLDGRVLFIEGRWNFLQSAHAKYRQGVIDFPVQSDAVFVHFIGQMKPWHLVSLPDAQNFFLKYQKASPWAKIPLEAPKDLRLIRKFARLLYAKGFYRRAVGLQMHYYVNKMAVIFRRIRIKKSGCSV